mmetsp:Transcript_18039/g.44972  ORF Transcript_18039/g.44972 Transcript_18039/m.44972 type:complete len:125 (-) Transcript_18039:155-529(-)
MSASKDRPKSNIQDSGLSPPEASVDHPHAPMEMLPRSCNQQHGTTSANGVLDRSALLARLAEVSHATVSDLTETLAVDPQRVEDLVTQLIFTGGNDRTSWSRAELCSLCISLLEDRRGSPHIEQ